MQNPEYEVNEDFTTEDLEAMETAEKELEENELNRTGKERETEDPS